MKKSVKNEMRALAGKGGPASAVLADLTRLSRNLWWSWQPEGPVLWQRVAEAAGLRTSAPERLSNPVALLAGLSASHRRRLARDTAVAELAARLLARLAREEGKPKRAAGLSAKAPVAYFSMEFGLHESLAIYAGGLGILAGDHIKSASDEGLPLVGVGLFYHNGYFRQELDERSGEQRVIHPRAATALLPIEAARDARGKELRVHVDLPTGPVAARIWQVRAGRASVYLLDSDLPENRPADRKINYRLYGGSREDRIRQEVLAGIGGVRALAALGISPGVWHLNEGHVAFLFLERLRALRGACSLSTAEALELIAGDTVFTTHTPVPEGNEVFDLALARRYLEKPARDAGIDVDEALSLGLDQGPGGQPVLSMTVLALRLSRFRNGVSQLHAEVSRKMWSKLWPGFRPEAAPITSVTNGVHTATWVAPAMDELYKRHLGRDWSRHLDDADYWKGSRRLPLDELIEIKRGLKRDLIEFVRRREAERLARAGWSDVRIRAHVERLLDPEAFTIGFARRFALYKRSALIFRDLKRAARLFGSRTRPVQIIFAGKPHPEDSAGKAVFEEIGALARRKELRGKVVLLENYDIEMARKLVRGVDLWLNNPRRPLEASGTSGQKVPVNGGLNLSILDGWWCEGAGPNTGWSFGKTSPYDDERRQDDEDAKALYETLERQVLPLYFERDRRGRPLAWARKVRGSLEHLVPRFSTSHMVLEYARRLYRPAWESHRALTAHGGRKARELAAWSRSVRARWPLVHVRRVEGALSGGKASMELFLAGIDPGDLRVAAELPHRSWECPVARVEPLGGGAWRLEVLIGRSASRSSPLLRVYPSRPELVHPQELGIALPIVL